MVPTVSPAGAAGRRIAVIGIVLVIAGCGSAAPAGTSTASPAASTAAPPATATARAVSPSPTAEPTLEPQPIPEEAVQAVELPAGTGPNVLAMSADRVWVELHRDDSVASMDPETLELTRHPEVQVHCGIASDGRDAVWTTHFRAGLLTRLDATTGESTLERQITDVCGLGVSESQVWVTSPATGKILKLDPTTGETLLEVEVLEAPFGATPVGDYIYASGEGAGGWLAVLDPADGRVITTKRAPDAVFADVIDDGFGSVWAVGRPTPSLRRLDPATLEEVATVAIGSEPSGLAITDSAIWVTRLSGTLSRIDPATMTVTGVWSTPYRFLAWPTLGFGRLWMTSLEDEAVVSIDLAALDG